MKRIGILSDTHSHWDERYRKFFQGCDEIWHAGDMGTIAIARQLEEIAPVRAVYGNCDGRDVRLEYPEILRFRIEDADVVMKHIGGSPGHYDSTIREELRTRTPALFVCGHSHILKIQHDASLGMLHINPGAAGLQGWQNVRTLVRLTVDGRRFLDLDVLEIKRDEEIC
ncbi:MAG: metallophosphatase family protein [Bacteroidaceae bacterium]|nr:metallophosphatase family protein [Bacteroidaceae bacterium]